MIYTLTLNPAIDYMLQTDSLRPGRTNRARAAALHFGGKGVNVSVVLRELGVESMALGFLAGFTGQALEGWVRRRGIDRNFVFLPEGHTRINVKLPDGTELNAPGPAVTEEDMARLLDTLDRPHAGDTLVISGSAPPGLPPTVYGDILARLEGRGIRFVVDAAGALLSHALPHRPFLVKPNRAELEELAGQRLDTDDALTAAARALQAQGAQNVLVSLGPDGALLLDAQGRVHRRAALPGRAVDPVGAGDAMVAGFLAGLKSDDNLSADAIPGSAELGRALDLALAAGCATAFSQGLATRREIFALCQKTSP